MAITDLTGTKWEVLTNSNWYLIGSNDFLPDPNPEFNPPEIVSVLGVVEADSPDEIIAPNIYERYNDPDEGWTYIPQQELSPSLQPWQYYVEGSVTNSGNVATIEITGGTDATNADLIAWLEQNATQIIEPTITDLTGYTWEANNSLINNGDISFGTEKSGGEPTIEYDIVFTFPNIPYYEDPQGNIYDILLYADLTIKTESGLNFGTMNSGWGQSDSQNEAVVIYYFDYTGATPTWYTQNAKTIKITGGTDATNTTLIQWLLDNGTLTAPEPTPSGVNNVSIGTLQLAKALVGNSEIVSMWLGDAKIYEKGGTPTTPNFILSNGDYLLTSENEYFNVMEEN